MIYKIIYHEGVEVSLKTEFSSAFATITNTALQISGSENICIKLDDFKAVELFRLHGLGRMLKIWHTDGVIFISVIRFKLIQLPLIGQFASVNFLKTGELNSLLRSRIPSPLELYGDYLHSEKAFSLQEFED